MAKQTKNIIILTSKGSEIKDGFMGNTGIVAAELYTGRTVEQIVKVVQNVSDLKVSQIKVSLSNLKNRSNVFTTMTQGEYELWQQENADKLQAKINAEKTEASKHEDIHDTDVDSAYPVTEDTAVEVKTLTEQQLDQGPQQPLADMTVQPNPAEVEKKIVEAYNELTTCYILFDKQYREGSTSSKIIKHVKEGLSKKQIILACVEDKESGLTEKQVKAYLANAVAKVKNLTFK